MLRLELLGVQEKIAHSREHRATTRDSVYDDIETTDYDAILKLYDKMRLSRDRVQLVVNSDTRQRRTILLAHLIQLRFQIELTGVAQSTEFA